VYVDIVDLQGTYLAQGIEQAPCDTLLVREGHLRHVYGASREYEICTQNHDCSRGEPISPEGHVGIDEDQEKATDGCCTCSDRCWGTVRRHRREGRG
jgi:hypothetical protein